MSEPIIINRRHVYEAIYARYSAPLFGITLKMSRNTKQAEEILMQAFRLFFLQRLFPQDHDQIFRHLLKLIIHIAAEKRNLSKQTIGNLIIKELKQARKIAVTA